MTTYNHLDMCLQLLSKEIDKAESNLGMSVAIHRLGGRKQNHFHPVGVVSIEIEQ